MAEEDVLIGQVFASRYRVDRLVGRGGMGRVYQATHTSIGKPVALKVLSPDLAGAQGSYDRFEREAAAASRLRHPNTIQIFDYGTSEDGKLFLAMEFLEGHTLADLIQESGNLSPARAVHVATQALKSLKEAHSQGIIHRDLKPENIFLMSIPGEPDFVKVLDFGIAKFVERDRIKETLTRPDGMCGTPLYVAPEQGLGYPVTPATDLYSLGVILYEMLSGVPPFAGDDPMTVIMMQVHVPPPPLPEVVRLSVPQELTDLLFRLLDKAPARRPQSAGDVLMALTSLPALSTEAPALAPRSEASAAAAAEAGPSADAASPSADRTALQPVSPLPLRGSDPDKVLTLLLPPPELRTGSRKLRVTILDVVTVILVIALVASGLVFYWLWNSDSNGSPRGSSSSAASSPARFDACVTRCTQEGLPLVSHGRVTILKNPERSDCETYCREQ